jgi:hypothetical protein
LVCAIAASISSATSGSAARSDRSAGQRADIREARLALGRGEPG